MRTGRIRTFLGMAAAVVLLTVSAAAAPAAGRAAPAAPLVTVVRTAPGVGLRTEVYRPAGPGPHPLLVMPGPFLVPAEVYSLRALRFAAAGFVVVAYQPRGFLGSGGTYGLAGPADVADASKMITWALEHTAADPHRVGLCGVSYGAGLGLLTAAADRRVRAVAALSGWADLLDVTYGGGTRRLRVPLLQALIALAEARLDPELGPVLRDLATSPEPTPAFRAFARARSPLTYRDRLNANGTAVLMAHGWLDPLEPPNGIGAFFDGLTVPKRLEYRRGGHATQEIPGFALPSEEWAGAQRWLERRLGVRSDGVGEGPPVLVEVRGHGLAHPEERFARPWPAATAPRAPRLEPLTGADPTINAFADSGANGGSLMVSGLLDQLLGISPPALPRLLPPTAAAVWQTAPARHVQRLRGIPALRTTVTPSAPAGTFIAYLYDVTPTGTAQLITHAPYSFAHHTPATPLHAHLDLFATAYDLPAGHRLALVIDGLDPLYLSRNRPGSTLTFHSDRTELVLPTRPD
ncbi:CocE/NonD family hydrolase [Streptomyces caatingaensis]|uniref:Xaa-Pro dipeptidyl-peptidase C-terminal domain-containing protein n=1 Tax=Streptomyces caatingaensis TaxID=1678637 RepID=A0A0K9XAK0_9ACTN|nr:CocE/NonD family hydrolase [Streptomyces caatingaensis]KNB50450.1 hypothetical protein AC230_20950 [Streptomyces caatingaensis]